MKLYCWEINSAHVLTTERPLWLLSRSAYVYSQQLFYFTHWGGEGDLWRCISSVRLVCLPGLYTEETVHAGSGCWEVSLWIFDRHTVEHLDWTEKWHSILVNFLMHLFHSSYLPVRGPHVLSSQGLASPFCFLLLFFFSLKLLLFHGKNEADCESAVIHAVADTFFFPVSFFKTLS